MPKARKTFGIEIIIESCSVYISIGSESNNRLEVMDLLCRIWYKKSRTNRSIAWMCVLCVCGIQFDALIARNSFSNKKKIRELFGLDRNLEAAQNQHWIYCFLMLLNVSRLTIWIHSIHWSLSVWLKWPFFSLGLETKTHRIATTKAFNKSSQTW